MQSIKSVLDEIYYTFAKQNDFFVAGCHKGKWTRWGKYSETAMIIDPNESWKIGKINQRQILQNEVVLDIEHKNFQWILTDLKKRNLEFWCWDTGSRGVHIHIFLHTEVTQIQKNKMIEHYGADEMKGGRKALIALENSIHHKSNQRKKLIQYNVKSHR